MVREPEATSDEYEELGEGYQLLINHYKSIDDTENQLRYLDRYIFFEKNISSNYIEIGNRINQEHTVPELLAEKEEMIEELAKRGTKNAFYYYIFIGISITLFSLFFFQWYKKKQLHKRFLAITKSSDKKSTEPHEAKVDIIVQKQELYEFDEQQINQIVRGLTEFESTKLFLDSSITLQSLAEKIGTNTSYLSKYINTEKKINFATYISDLRIEHAISKLQEDAKFRSYTIEAIASEVGFSNTRSFTNHFKRITGITVSYFIKRLSEKTPKLLLYETSYSIYIFYIFSIGCFFFFCSRNYSRRIHPYRFFKR
jgi:AraC-like DNA-binding protein